MGKIVILNFNGLVKFKLFYKPMGFENSNLKQTNGFVKFEYLLTVFENIETCWY